MKNIFSIIKNHLLVSGLFVVISLVFFYPVLQGKKIYQSDIVQYSGMSKLQNDFRSDTGEETYWTDAAFGGMPTYQLGAKYPHNYIKQLDLFLRFLPRPADYLFLYFIGIYLLLLVLQVDWKLAFLGAVGFGFSTYLIIILGVGHNAKAHAIGYMPLVLAGVFYCIRKPKLLSFILTSIALALELNANHFQMTYYLGFLILIIWVVYLLNAFKNKSLKSFFVSSAGLLAALVFAIGLNAANLLATQEYAEFSTRGKSYITINPDGTPKETVSGLDKNYITEYSYGLMETFDLFVPRLYGGSNSEKLGADSKTYDFLRKNGVPAGQAMSFAENLPTYWGSQPIVAAPAYLGAVMLFLMMLGIMLAERKTKKWLLAGIIISLLLSWGKNFSVLTDLFIEYVPLYDKFRAVSSIQVLLELCVPVLGILGLHQFIKGEHSLAEKKKALAYAFSIPAGLALIFIFFKDALFDFVGANDGYYAQNYGQEFVEALRDDRASMLLSDTFRSLVFVALAAVSLWLFMLEKIKSNTLVIALSILALIDLGGVAKRYVNKDSFVDARVYDRPFSPTEADLRILSDKSHFRVLDLTANPFNSARASFFFNSIGGYHAAKPAKMQDLFDFYISRNKIEILNLLNTKYIIQEGNDGKAVAGINPDANGPAWLIDSILFVSSQNEELLKLGSIDSKKTALVHQDFKNLIDQTVFPQDSTAQINLKTYQPNHLVYVSETTIPRVAIFSEMYYPKGWNAYLNGQKVPYFRADYVLRALKIPAGKNIIEFKFEPQVVETGGKIALLSSILIGILMFGALFYFIKGRR
ncbi:MAG: hypothetical protein U1C58_00505 [Flavobacteriaceae bacterium]|nr:hypothetical protein [Flavobacteriaceae bacterium]